MAHPFFTFWDVGIHTWEIPVHTLPVGASASLLRFVNLCFVRVMP
jgi:hypothetical protein